MCPICGSKGYAGFNDFECSKEGCPNYKPQLKSAGTDNGPRYESYTFRTVFLYRLGKWDIRKFERAEDDKCLGDPGLFLAYERHNAHIRILGSDDKEAVRRELKKAIAGCKDATSCDD